LSWANGNEVFFRILWSTKSLYSHWLGTVQPPVRALDSCDWPNYLKLFYIIIRKFFSVSLHHPARPIQSPWRWRPFVPLEQLNFTWCENPKQDYHLINSCWESLASYIVTVFFCRLWYYLYVKMLECNDSKCRVLGWRVW
jgi:hypothetical protein